jgi:DNA-binding response OmpR family regulator
MADMSERGPAHERAYRVLLVEDDDDVRFTVGVMLMGAGFTVYEADSVATAEELAATHDFGVALIDLRLGEDDGWSLVRSLSAREATAVLIVTGDADPVDAALGLELGAEDYITKPFSSRELVARVKRSAETVRKLSAARPGG